MNWKLNPLTPHAVPSSMVIGLAGGNGILALLPPNTRQRQPQPAAAWSMMIIICTTARGEDGRRGAQPSPGLLPPPLFLPVGHAIVAFSSFLRREGGLQWPDKLCSSGNRSRFLVAPFFSPLPVPFPPRNCKTFPIRIDL